MPAIMIILNIVFITGILVAIVGLCAWGIVSDRPLATHLTNRAVARAQRAQQHGFVEWAQQHGFRERRRVPREVSGYRGPGRRAIDVGA
jgi:hypothetical protein